MISEIGTVATRSELDDLMSWQTQEILEQMQQQQDEQTTTFNESVNQTYDKLEDKVKVVDGQLCQVRSSVSTHATSLEQSKPHWMFK